MNKTLYSERNRPCNTPGSSCKLRRLQGKAISARNSTVRKGRHNAICSLDAPQSSIQKDFLVNKRAGFRCICTPIGIKEANARRSNSIKHAC